MSQHDTLNEQVPVNASPATARIDAEADTMPDTVPDALRDTALSRRDLLMRGGAMGAAGLLAGGVASEARAQNKTDKKAAASDTAQIAGANMPTATLGRTGVKVSRLAMGGAWNVDAEVVALGLEQGINYLDTAEVYQGGQSERAFGEFLKASGATGHSKARQKLWVVTKTPDYHNIETRLARSLSHMQQDYVDCYYLHGIDDPALPANADIKAAATRLKKAGKIRAFGFSCHDGNVVECLNAAADSDAIDVVMFRYDYHYYKSDALNRAMDRCHKAGVGLVAMKTQVGGMTLPDRFNPFRKQGLNQHQAAIKAVAADERIPSICSEMTNVEHIRQNAQAVASKLTVGEARAIEEHARLISHLWCRGCDHICRAASGAGKTVAVADTLRLLMYHDHYGKTEHARRLFREMPAGERDLAALDAGDWQAAQAACPHHLPLAKLMPRVRERLA